MDIHTRVVAALHIVYGLLGAFFMLSIALVIGGFVAFLPLTDIPSFLLQFGMWFFIILMLISVAEVIAGIALLMGSSLGRVFTIVFGVFDLLHFPIGTVLGVYTLWALLREQPATSGRLN